jgi:hypothetical protein
MIWLASFLTLIVAHATLATPEAMLGVVPWPEPHAWSPPCTNKQQGLTCRFGVSKQEINPSGLFQVTVEIVNQSDKPIHLIAEGGHTNMLQCVFYADAKNVGHAPIIGGPLIGPRTIVLAGGATVRANVNGFCFVKSSGRRQVCVGFFAASEGTPLSNAHELRTGPLDITFTKEEDAQPKIGR